MSDKNLDYCLIQDEKDIEGLLKNLFMSSSSRIKKNFSKSILNKPLKKHSTLKIPLNFANHMMINPLYIGDKLEIIEETNDFIVFTKNPNQFIHPLGYDESNNCLSYFRNIGRTDILEVNSSEYDRGLLYRLDYETSGVVIYVKNENLYKELRENFQSVAKEKIYHAWVCGLLAGEQTLKHSFSKSGQKGMRVEVGQTGEYETSGELFYRVLEQDITNNRTLVEVHLKTGLRHQIRAQMAFIGFPLLGDEFYGGQRAPRLYLHAYKYQITVQEKHFVWQSNPINFK